MESGNTVDSYIVLDDDDSLRESLVRSLERRGLSAIGVRSLVEMRNELQLTLFSRAIVDLRVGTESGLDAISLLREKAPSCKIVIVTGYGSIATTQEALRRGAWYYLTKPVDTDAILRAFSDKGEEQVPLRVPSLEEVEWDHLQRVLHEAGGNVSHAARALGMHRRSLQRKLQKNPPRNS